MASPALPVRPMGKQGLMASMQGYGCMGLSAFYGTALEEKDGLAVLHKAYELGVTHFDTAEVYKGKNAAGEDAHNETLVGKFVNMVGRDKVTFATKYFPGGPGKQECQREAVRATVEASLQRLGLDSIDLYYLHRVPEGDGLTNWMNACKELVAEGKIKYLGLSEATPDEIRMAHGIHPLTAIQQEWSLVVRNLEEDLLPVCRELGIAVVAYSPLARGLTSLKVKKDEDWKNIGNDAESSKYQTSVPYATGENLAENVKLLEPLEAEAAKLQVTPAELSLAWLQCQGEDVFPIPGTTKIANLEKNVHAAHLSLTVARDVLETVGPAARVRAGDRYSGMGQSMTYESRKSRAAAS